MEACPVCGNKRGMTAETVSCPQCETSLEPFRRVQTLNSFGDKFSQQLGTLVETQRTTDVVNLSNARKLEELEQRVETLQATSVNLRTTQGELTKTKEELQATQGDLTRTSEDLQITRKKTRLFLMAGVPVALVLAGFGLWQYRASSQLKQHNSLLAQQESHLEQNNRLLEQQVAETVHKLTQEPTSKPETLANRIALLDGIQSKPDSARDSAQFVSFTRGLFLPGKAELTDDSKYRLAELVTAVSLSIKQDHLTYQGEVEGSTDNLPFIVKGRDLNPQLAAERARAVLAFLQAHSKRVPELKWIMRPVNLKKRGAGSAEGDQSADRTVYIHLTPLKNSSEDRSSK